MSRSRHNRSRAGGYIRKRKDAKSRSTRRAERLQVHSILRGEDADNAVLSTRPRERTLRPRCQQGCCY